MRAEFLRLRRMPFVEAARCMGIPGRAIMGRHILPNALTPIITLLPFSLVGAIDSLAALDYLGFGLPPPTPSWGELLQQAQQFRWAWWLILYPALMLFVVTLLGVFIGEGVRDAYDPRRFSRME
jgi:microcin C transport system permease protein